MPEGLLSFPAFLAGGYCEGGARNSAQLPLSSRLESDQARLDRLLERKRPNPRLAGGAAWKFVDRSAL